ncbi:MAG: CehA/McbA family metallohydrolase, partial [Opitutales bacterium]
EYVIYATRGFEYGVATKKVSVKKGETESVNLVIGREVPTKGWVSCDPHIHVRNFSGHGDCTVEERIPTIAGEGVELPVATDHNHHTDYRPFQRSADASSFFTPVIGNEVTTKVGHFNAFPITKGASLPNHKTESWPELFRSMRSTPGVEIILLNHPRNVHSGFSPTDPDHFNPVTGSSKREGHLAVDAIEVITSAALQTDPMGPFRDWFALLNSGRRLTAIGSSDTHDVNRYLLGQGRTYVRCPDNDPAAIDVAAACRAIREGRALVSMGLLANMKVEGRFEVGDLATDLPALVSIEVEVLGPRWVNADHLVLYANGLPIWEMEVAPAPNKVRKVVARREFRRPAHDVHLVLIATGPGVTKPFWEIPRPYQHKTKEYTPRVIGATNPIWLDADGDGKYTSPHAYAGRIIGEKDDLEAIIEKLSAFDEAVSSQAAALLATQGIDLGDAKATAALLKAAPAVARGFDAFLNAEK